jgi:hypothetical protein
MEVWRRVGVQARMSTCGRGGIEVEVAASSGGGSKLWR